MMHAPETSQPHREQGPRNFLEVGTHSSPVFLIGSRRFSPDERYIGVDINLEELRSAADTAKIIQRESGHRMLFINADGRRLPVTEGSIHEALLSNVLGDPKTRDRKQLLAELYRVLAEHGKLVVVECYTPGITPEQQTVQLCQDVGYTFIRLTKPTDPEWDTRARLYGNLAVTEPDGDAYMAEFEKGPKE